MAEPEEVITEQIFKTYFANSKTYNVPGDWPHETYLVSKVDIKKKHRIIALTDVKVFQNIWGHHAQYFFLQYLEQNILKNKTDDTLSVDVEIFPSYSPCHTCAKSMVNFITRMRDRNICVTLTVHIGTFYKIYDANHTTQPNVVGLMELICTPRVELKTFNGQKDWERFLEIAELPSDWIHHTRTNQRVLREENDSLILDRLKTNANARRLQEQLATSIDFDVHLQALSLSKETSDQYLRCNDCKITLCECHRQNLQLQGFFTGLGTGVLALYYKGKIALEILLRE